eukprot:TRINITY_DN40260_c0_g1_i2.p1 TRINITY_DN40260_c0_g1~~TRINITY_DN40260_c0_g1_i2.p1  ORF type:complete len:152 (-),score=0.02 TRINITY_DN40260_c0_g1_i2:45-500(-)
MTQLLLPCNALVQIGCTSFQTSPWMADSAKARSKGNLALVLLVQCGVRLRPPGPLRCAAPRSHAATSCSGARATRSAKAFSASSRHRSSASAATSPGCGASSGPSSSAGAASPAPCLSGVISDAVAAAAAVRTFDLGELVELMSVLRRGVH